MTRNQSKFTYTIATTCNSIGKDSTWLATGNAECCKTDGPCGEGEGDCDNDGECAGSLVCGSDNCSWNPDPNDNWDDCCEDPAETTTPAGCIFEQDTKYHGNNLNHGPDDPRQSDAESCRLFCKDSYPTSTHFDWVSPANGWTAGHNTCWCKTSIANTEVLQGTIAGEVNCGGEKSCVLMTSSQGLPKIAFKLQYYLDEVVI